MAESYSLEACRELEERVRSAGLYRPMHVGLYEAGAEVEYVIKGVACGKEGRARLLIDRFVGGGFAGQVYRVLVKELDSEAGEIEGLKLGNTYAMKILIPPSGFSKLFRNALYWTGFQGPFQLQVNPAAARAGALWQKFIRRGAKVRFGSGMSVVDVYAPPSWTTHSAVAGN